MKIFFHTCGFNSCGWAAFRAKATGPFNTLPSTNKDDIILKNGSHPKEGAFLLCGSCEKPFTTYGDTLFIVTDNSGSKVR